MTLSGSLANRNEPGALYDKSRQFPGRPYQRLFCVLNEHFARPPIRPATARHSGGRVLFVSMALYLAHSHTSDKHSRMKSEFDADQAATGMLCYATLSLES